MIISRGPRIFSTVIDSRLVCLCADFSVFLSSVGCICIIFVCLMQMSSDLSSVNRDLCLLLHFESNFFF